MVDIYQKVTDRIITLLEQGTIPWRQPWSGTVPTNLATRKSYNGINFLFLGCLGFESNYWLTYKQAGQLGGGIRAGEKSPAFVVYTDTWNCKKKLADGTEGIEVRWFLKYTPVFNIIQCRGIEAPEVEQGRSIEPLDVCTSFLRGLKEQPRIEIGHLAAYLPDGDKIVMPDISHFQDAEDYHASLFHELTHWTGAAHRLNRPLTRFESNNKGYAREELIAEMAAAFLCARCHIDTATIENQAAYINSWLRVLRNDRKLVPEAAKAARIAVEYLEGGSTPTSIPASTNQAAV